MRITSALFPALVCLAPRNPVLAHKVISQPTPSRGTYRMPFADGTTVQVFDDFHVHFEVATPDSAAPIDSGGFLLDNNGGKRERNPRFCGFTGGFVSKGSTYHSAAC